MALFFRVGGPFRCRSRRSFFGVLWASYSGPFLGSFFGVQVRPGRAPWALVFFGVGVGRLGGACAVVARSVGGPRRGRRCVFCFDGGCSRAARLRVAAAARRWRVRSCCAWFLLLWLGAGALRGAGARRVRFAGATCGRRAGCAFAALKFSNPRSRYDGDPVGRARLLCVCVFAPWSRFCVAACFSFCGFRVLKSGKSFYFFR